MTPVMEETSKRSIRAPHIMCGSTLSNWLRVLRRYGGIDVGYRKQACLITAVSALLAPSAWFERVWFSRRLSRTQIREPIFLIGHWQSGHSLLHHYLCRDPRAGYVDAIHCAIPSNFLLLRSLVSRLLRKRLPATRQADSTPLRLLSPQGDDMMMAGLSELSNYHAYYFPCAIERVIERSVFFDGLGDAEIETRMRRYHNALRRVAYDTGKTRLVLRNAANTARIRQLLRLFPDAKFVHLYRNPFHVYVAERDKWRGLVEAFGLQKPDYDRIDACIVGIYKRLLCRLFEDQSLISPSQFFEIRYEDLLSEPLQALRDLYRQLDLSGFDEARDEFERYAANPSVRLAGTDSKITPEIIRLVETHWNFTIQRWGYRATDTRPS